MAKETFNYTPLPTFKVVTDKKPFKVPTAILAGLVIVLAVAVGLVGYLITTQESIQTKVPAAVPTSPPALRTSPTAVPTSPQAKPKVSPTSALLAANPTVTPIPVACGTKGCDDSTNPCKSGLICVEASDGASYCTYSSFQNACIASPSQTSCCTASSNTPTPTEILLAKGSTPTASPTSSGTTEIPEAGFGFYAQIFAVISVGVIFIGLLL